MLPLISDGCSGFAWAEAIWPSISQCCLVHDLGGTDGMLVDCLQGALVWWLWWAIPLALLVVTLFRPLYNFLKKIGLWPSKENKE